MRYKVALQLRPFGETFSATLVMANEPPFPIDSSLPLCRTCIRGPFPPNLLAIGRRFLGSTETCSRRFLFLVVEFVTAWRGCFDLHAACRRRKVVGPVGLPCFQWCGFFFLAFLRTLLLRGCVRVHRVWIYPCVFDSSPSLQFDLSCAQQARLFEPFAFPLPKPRLRCVRSVVGRGRTGFHFFLAPFGHSWRRITIGEAGFLQVRMQARVAISTPWDGTGTRSTDACAWNLARRLQHHLQGRLLDLVHPSCTTQDAVRST